MNILGLLFTKSIMIIMLWTEKLFFLHIKFSPLVFALYELLSWLWFLYLLFVYMLIQTKWNSQILLYLMYMFSFLYTNLIIPMHVVYDFYDISEVDKWVKMDELDLMLNSFPTLAISRYQGYIFLTDLTFLPYSRRECFSPPLLPQRMFFPLLVYMGQWGSV